MEARYECYNRGTIEEAQRRRVRRPDWAADATLAEIMRRILAAGEPQKIVLFGSRARGDARDDSDYDLLLVEPSELPRHKPAARYRRALTGWPAPRTSWSGHRKRSPNGGMCRTPLSPLLFRSGLCSMSDRLIWPAVGS